MGNENKYVLAMYDVRGIQSYIFNTPKVKDAIGASFIVENIIADALADAVKSYKDTLSVELEWCNKDGVIEYTGNNEFDVQVLYIGGGNAFVIYRDESLCIEINKYMSKYIIEETYSLQLAVAIQEITGNYCVDQRAIRKKMDETKAIMTVSKPLGTLPIIKKNNQTIALAEEKKRNAEKIKRKDIDSKYKMFEQYITEKGIDSIIAVVHIDGNNMGLRIRKLTDNIKDYKDGVNTMRKISYNINTSYKKVFDEMQKVFVINKSEGQESISIPQILPILVAGDDITYVCNGKVVLQTVEYYVNEINKCAMYGDTEEEQKEYEFSVCAGVAYINSHFPFSVAYEVAEACCGSAKIEAKKGNESKVGNWMDYQIVKSIHTRDLAGIRAKEYVTCEGKNLICRPYYIETENDDTLAPNEEKKLKTLLSYVKFFKNESQEEGVIPRNFQKRLRNTYPLGETQITILKKFLESRGHKMPDEKYEMYIGNVAKWYDALEIMDYVELKEKKQDEQV